MRFVTCLLAVMGVLVSAFHGHAYEKKRLIIATEGAKPPFNYLDKQRNLRGFEIDLGKALCADLKIECEFKSLAWDRLLPNLENGRVDLVISTMRPTPARQKRVAFTAPYALMGHVLVQNKNTSGSLQKVGVEAGCMAAVLAQKNFSHLDIAEYGSTHDAQIDLANGALDGIVLSMNQAQEWFSQGKEGACCTIAQRLSDDPTVTGGGYSIALRKNDKVLKARLDEAIAARKATGQLAQMMQQYFQSPLF